MKGLARARRGIGRRRRRRPCHRATIALLAQRRRSGVIFPRCLPDRYTGIRPPLSSPQRPASRADPIITRLTNLASAGLRDEIAVVASRSRCRCRRRRRRRVRRGCSRGLCRVLARARTLIEILIA